MQEDGLPPVLRFLKESNAPGCQAAAAGVVKHLCMDAAALQALVASSGWWCGKPHQVNSNSLLYNILRYAECASDLVNMLGSEHGKARLAAAEALRALAGASDEVKRDLFVRLCAQAKQVPGRANILLALHSFWGLQDPGTSI